MRVAFVACSAPARTAVGNLLADKVAVFLDRGSEVRVFLESLDGVHPGVAGRAERSTMPVSRDTWAYLADCDLVFFEMSQGFDLLNLLPLLVDEKPRLLATYYGLSPSKGWPGPQRELLERGARQRGLLWCADAVVVLSRFSADELIAATAIPRHRVHQLPIPLQRPGVSNAIPGVPNRPTLLYVGRLAINKRVPLLIEALAHLPDAQAWIVGNDQDIYADQARLARERAERLGVSDRVRWLGDVPDDALPDLYRQASVLVLPSIHEGLGIPVLEAQAAGTAVVAARAAALPETVADAGLTFRPDDVLDLVRQIRRLLTPAAPLRDTPMATSRRVALVSFRFGEGFVGGAETSLRTIGLALQNAGCRVEVFTTCTIRESNWANDLPAGDSTEAGCLVHRFPIDPHDRGRHDDAFRAILERRGDVSAEVEADYLRHSVQSSALIRALAARENEFDAIITGPYLHGLTHQVARTFPGKTLLLPCFHDEACARLNAWIDAYDRVAGILYHTPEEQDFAQARLGLNGPAAVVGTLLPPVPTIAAAEKGTVPRTLVYCGRFSDQKNVPLLLAFAKRYQANHPGRFRWIVMGEGGVTMPAEPWMSNLGRVADDVKHRVLAEADALVQLSAQESLSLVVLEAWQHATPVIVHHDAVVLRGHLDRCRGGVAIADEDAFTRALDDLWRHPDAWRERGRFGRRYVRDQYQTPELFAGRLLDAIDELAEPLVDRLRRRGLVRAQRWSREAWREAFDAFVEQCLDAPPRERTRDLAIEPLVDRLAASPGQRSILVPVRLHNRGTLPAPAEMSAVHVELRDQVGSVVTSRDFAPGDTILPGHSMTVMVAVDLPGHAFQGRLTMATAASECSLPAAIDRDGAAAVLHGGAGPVIEAAESALAHADARTLLPADYVDVCEGRFAGVKRWIKNKVLNNFKRAYVDVLSAQQSEVNRRLVESVQHLTECCRALDQTVRSLQDRLADERPETRMTNAESLVEAVEHPDRPV